ncbi:MAG TPA: biotin/lipoyl-binding protein, partial [Caulobacteraceae bacterium]|nr:biotin/lipoyl-binding protein [Caulobacteraceae bacterium]
MTKKKLPLIAAGAAVLLLLIGGVAWWQGKQRWEATDNAYVQADTVVISPQVTGYVAEVLVQDNQRVAAGQELVRLDQAEARAALAQAEANVAALEAAVHNVDDRAALGQAEIARASAGVVSATAQARLAATDLDRY